jgi:protein-L-isoaspartate(D-aspartate) O-methyltransferase
VWTVEIDAEIAACARTSLENDGVANVTVEVGDGLAGWPEHAPYDCIMVSGGVTEIPAALLPQLNVGGHLFAFVGTAPLMTLRRVTRQAEDVFVHADLLETVVPMLRSGLAPQGFVF